ncbi:MAG: TonB-dependent receptor, partial [Leptospiraceae bacterium]|nr:TonB-dependent receptor [Leptospiraceae bacterium]
TSNIILISDFSTKDTGQDTNISARITDELTKSLKDRKMIVQKAKSNNLDKRLNEAKSQGARFLVEGNYYRDPNLTNLNLYLQIYDPETRLLVDAFSINDDIYKLEDLKLDRAELKANDEERIKNFAEKSAIHIVSNPQKKEKRENLEQYALKTPEGEKFRPYTRSDDKASEEAADQVFDLLKGQIITSATKTAKKTNEAPNIVSVVTDKEIQDYGRISINDVLYQLPGFAPSQSNDKRSVGARGMYEGWNNNHLLVLVDGVQFNDLFYGTALTWPTTPLNMVKSIEVIRGPGSALYGSNATNGVVSLNTYSGEDLNGEIRVRARVGNQGTKIYDFLTGNKGKLFSHVLSYNSYETDGVEEPQYDNSGREDAFGFLQKFKVKDRQKNHYILAKIEGEGDLKGLSFQYHRQYWNYQTYNGWFQIIPDNPGTQQEGRDTFVAKYSNNITSKLIQEYVFKYSKSFWDYSSRFITNGDPDFPAGVSENLYTSIDNLFGRAQFTYLFTGGASLVGGVEAGKTNYLGDKFHSSNIDMNKTGTDSANPNNMFLPVNPVMDWITDKPIYNIAAFAQATSGKLWNRIEFTLGIRYDEANMHFRGIDIPHKDILGTPTVDIYNPDLNTSYTYSIPGSSLGPPYVTNEKKVYRKTSPRIGIVYFVSNRLTFKAMAGRAFRAPAPGELFGVNTYIGGAVDPRKLSPEVIKTGELGMDWFITNNLNFRLNGFQTRFENVISYGENNGVENIYTQGTKGVETELLAKFKYVNGFINYSRFFRYLDSNLDSRVTKHPNEITVAPGNTINAGISGNWNAWQSSISVQRQGRVSRRLSDLGKVDPLTGHLLDNKYSDPYTYPMYRTKRIAPWYNVTFRLVYSITENFQLGFNVLNALNNTQIIVTRGRGPFDYLREGRRILIDFQGTF